MSVHSLGYLVIESPDVDEWRTFATATLGMMEAPGGPDGELHLRIDDHPFRLAVLPGAEHRLVCSGWQVADNDTLESVRSRLGGAGHDVVACSPAEAAARRVGALLRVTDPGGAVVEVFSGRVYDHTPFMSPVGVSAFVAGDLGLGHVVMLTPDAERSWHFYRDLLGFRVSDVMRRGDEWVRFLRCNSRHHSLGLAPGGRSQIQHFMLEVGTLDDVGYAYDRFLETGRKVFMGLGKHTNDRMVSFYGRTPGGFAFEYGCGGLRVDESTWTVAGITRGSLWGHHPVPKPSG